MGRPKNIEKQTNDFSVTVEEESHVDVSPQVNDETKNILKDSLRELGIDFNENDSTADLTKKLVQKTKNFNDPQKSLNFSRKEYEFKNYATNTNLTNKDFIKKCFDMGIPDYYLNAIEETRAGKKSFWYILTDADSALSKDNLLSKIRAAGVNHINVIAAAQAIAARVTPKQNK